MTCPRLNDKLIVESERKKVLLIVPSRLKKKKSRD